MIKKLSLMLITGLVLMGCEISSLDGPAPRYQPVKPKPVHPKQQKPKPKIKINRNVCSNSCVEMAESSQMSTQRKREKMLKEYAVMGNLSVHEQIHLVNISLACLTPPYAAEVMMTLARNPNLTKRAHRHLKIKSDKLYSKDEKRLLKLLKQNPGK